MPIKIAPRANIAPEVLDLYQEVARAKVEKIKEIIDASYSYRDAVKRYSTTLGKLAPIIKGESGAGKGMDFELSRMRSLDFERVIVKNNWIMAYTRSDFRMEEVGSGRKPIAYWDCGVYACCISKDGLISGNMGMIHFIPQRDPLIRNRHPHHTASQSADFPTEPLKWRTSTCWSDFASPIAAALADADLVEVLRMMRIFVGRYYNGSPLARPDGRTMSTVFYERIEV